MLSLSTTHSRSSTLLALLLAIFSTSCTFRVLAYRNADTFIAHRLQQTFGLESSQRRKLEPAIDKALAWHRSSELPLYIEALEGFKQRFADGLQEDDHAWVNAQIQLYYRRIWDAIESESVSFLADLNQKNLDALLQTNTERNQDKEEQLAQSPENRLEKELDQLVGRFRTWLGPLNQEQINRIAEFVRVTKDFEPARFEQSKINQAAFASALASHSNSVIKTSIQKILFERESLQTQEFQTISMRRKEEWKKLFFDLDQSLTTKQRKHLLQEISSWVEDLHTLGK